MAEYYCYEAKKEYYKLESDSAGKGFRFMTDPKQGRLEFFGFEERTAKFISDAMATGQVKRITELEFMRAAREFWQYVAKGLADLDKLIAE